MTALRECLAQEVPGLRVWQNRPEIEGGVAWWRQIDEPLQRVEFLIIVMIAAVRADAKVLTTLIPDMNRIDSINCA